MRVFITGGAGFVGANVADHHLALGDEVVIFDNLSREGTSGNVEWLRERHGGRAALDSRGHPGLRLPSRRRRTWCRPCVPPGCPGSGHHLRQGAAR